MKRITAAERTALFTHDVNEIRDGRDALIKGQVFSVVSLDHLTVVAVYDVTGYDLHNLSSETYDYPESDMQDAWLYENDEEAANRQFLFMIATRLGIEQ